MESMWYCLASLAVQYKYQSICLFSLHVCCMYVSIFLHSAVPVQASQSYETVSYTLLFNLFSLISLHVLEQEGFLHHLHFTVSIGQTAGHRAGQVGLVYGYGQPAAAAVLVRPEPVLRTFVVGAAAGIAQRGSAQGKGGQVHLDASEQDLKFTQLLPYGQQN